MDIHPVKGLQGVLALYVVVVCVIVAGVAVASCCCCVVATAHIQYLFLFFGSINKEADTKMNTVRGQLPTALRDAGEGYTPEVI